MLDVIIIGSGFAGLVAARILTQAKRSVLVLEVRPQSTPTRRWRSERGLIT